MINQYISQRGHFTGMKQISRALFVVPVLKQPILKNLFCSIKSLLQFIEPKNLQKMMSYQSLDSISQ